MSEYKWTPAVTSSGRPCMFRSEVNVVVVALEQRVQELERRLRAVDRATYGAFPEQQEALAGESDGQDMAAGTS